MFYFKQFTINDNKSTMKVGTDAVILGALTYMPKIESNYQILDIGTGCGILTLMMAQKFPNSNIDGIEIDSVSAKQAQDNFKQSPWATRLNCINIKIQEYNKKKYDLIISNPPYFENSLKATNSQRNLARHTNSLPIQDLIIDVSRLLKRDGIFWCILPHDTAQKAIIEASNYNLYCNDIFLIHNNPQKPIKRCIFKLSHNTNQNTAKHYYIRNSTNTYSEWYKSITAPFYTHLK